MLTFHAGQTVVIAVPLTRDGEPFLAAAGTKWTLRDHAGLPVPAYTNQTVADVSDTTLVLTIPADAQTIDSSRLFEKRFVTVNGTTQDGGTPFEVVVNYRLVPWLNFSVTNDTVRSFIGIDAGELADSDIDLTAAYLTLATLTGLAPLQTALNSGTLVEEKANRALVGLATLACLPGLRQRISKKADDGTLKVERFTVDFDQLAEDARRAVADGQLAIGVVLDDGSAPTLFILATPSVDVITGA